jgi:hypothetical protein
MMWWGTCDRWDQIRDFGAVIMPPDEALGHVAKDRSLTSGIERLSGKILFPEKNSPKASA